jgi:hypothetical protein
MCIYIYIFFLRPLSFEKRRIQETAKKPQLPIEPNQEVISALYTAFYASFSVSEFFIYNLIISSRINNISFVSLSLYYHNHFQHLQRTNLRYLVTISLSKKTIEGRAWQCANMTGFEVGCFIAMTIVRQESDVTVATFKDNDINVVDVSNEETYEQIMRKLREISTPNIKLNKPLLWAMEMKKTYDIFINVVDQVHEKYDKSQESLAVYRNTMKLPEAK